MMDGGGDEVVEFRFRRCLPEHQVGGALLGRVQHAVPDTRVPPDKESPATAMARVRGPLPELLSAYSRSGVSTPRKCADHESRRLCRPGQSRPTR